MKKILLLMFLLTSILNAQISVTRTSSSKKAIKQSFSNAYDSTYNFPGVKIKFLIGQTLFVKPKPEYLRKNGFLNFIKNPKRSEFAPPNIYMHSMGISSGYIALANRFFLFKDIVRTKSKKLALVLVDKNEADTIYYIYNKYRPNSFPFLVAGYFKKIENKKLGKKFILRKLSQPIIYLTDGFEAKPGQEKLWTIDKVTLDDKNFDISYILKDELNNKFLVSKNNFEKTALSEANYILIKEEYPEKYKIILNENVIVGMTKKACELSLGKPNKINTSGNLEQWQYKNLDLYFKNGLLSSYKSI
ncbi:MAG: hypothetical protein QM486_09285 [Flavobacteriaceae bacterium]